LLGSRDFSNSFEGGARSPKKKNNAKALTTAHPKQNGWVGAIREIVVEKNGLLKRAGLMEKVLNSTGGRGATKANFKV